MKQNSNTSSSHKNMALILATCAVLISIAIYTLTSKNIISDKYNNDTMLGLLAIIFVIIISLCAVIFSRIVKLWVAKQKEYIGSKMQNRIVLIFTLLTVIPTIVMASFSVSFFIYGLQSWFDNKINDALENSVAVAEAYLEEHSTNLKADAYAMGKDISRNALQLIESKEDFKKFLTAQAAWRVLNDVVVFRKKDILASSEGTITYFIDLESISEQQFEAANKGDIILFSENNSKVSALIKLNNFRDTYLLISRNVDAKVTNYTRDTKDSFNQYKKIKENTLKVQYQFAAAFVGVSIILLLSAIWLGLVFAGRIIAPIHKLIDATERVKSGDLTVQLVEGKRNDEISTLFQAFNRMTGNLQRNQKQLYEVNAQIDKRRRLIEAVFSGVTSGVISLDEHKRVKTYNKSAIEILKIADERIMGRYIADVFPEITPYFAKTKNSPDKIVQQELSIKRGGLIYNFLVRIVAEEFYKHVEGYIITIEDITELVIAQRTAAWSDVARRIAHEIKNPLTPITLSAERIKAKYESSINEDEQENFNRYLDTIIRHSENIEKIVIEFSAFAKMPQPVMKSNNLTEVVSDVMFSEKVVNPEVDYIFEGGSEVVMFDFDKEQINRLFINLLKNSAESIKENQSKKGAADSQKNNITVKISADSNIVVEITDSGKGFPPELINRLTEPYVTTRENGTGLGLAIVKKIVDDHGGSLEMSNVIDGDDTICGAKTVVTFKI